MNVLDCFSGIGGGILVSKILGHRVVCGIEKDAYCRKVLVKNQNEGFLRPFPIWSDITTFDGHAWRGCVDLVQGGFPCQDISIAGRREGITGKRSGLWFEMFRVICEIHPQWVFIENVANFKKLGLATVLHNLAGIGYDAEWLCLGADDVGANHRRKRLWVLAKRADTVQPGLETLEQDESESKPVVGLCEDAANADSQRQPQPQGNIEKQRQRTGDVYQNIPDTESKGYHQPQGVQHVSSRNWWLTEPGVGRLVNGFPDRVSALRGLGNAQVPLQAAVAFTILQRRFQ